MMPDPSELADSLASHTDEEAIQMFSELEHNDPMLCKHIRPLLAERLAARLESYTGEALKATLNMFCHRSVALYEDVSSLLYARSAYRNLRSKPPQEMLSELLRLANYDSEVAEKVLELLLGRKKC